MAETGKRLKICASVLAVVLLAGCGQMKSTKSGNAVKEEPVSNRNTQETEKKEIKMCGWRIQPGCHTVTEKMADRIYEDISDLEQKLNEGIRRIENSRLIFYKEETVNGDIDSKTPEGNGETENTVIVRAVFEADYTNIRNPKENPVIQGMYEAKNELATEKEKKAAQECIEGYLNEFYPQYKKTQRISLEFAVCTGTRQKDAYMLYYEVIDENGERLEPLIQYAMENWMENPEERRQMGKETLLENVDITAAF